MASYYDKTVAVTGMPTYLVLGESLMKSMIKYVDHFRGIIMKDDVTCDDVFLKEDGGKLDSENISACFR